MGLFIKQELFHDYLNTAIENLNYRPERVLIATRTAYAKATVNCIYIVPELIFIARYDSNWDTFESGFGLMREQIRKIEVKDHLLSTLLLIHTNIPLKNGAELTLKLNLSKLNFTPWHAKNLRLLLPLLKKGDTDLEKNR